MDPGVPRVLIHGTAVVIATRAVLLLGASGAGKSDLAFRVVSQPVLLDGQPVPVALLADDQVLLERTGTTIIAHAPEPIRGLLEIRGLGIAALAAADPAPLALIVRLVASAETERLPDRATMPILGLPLPVIEVDPVLPSAAARIVLAASGRIQGLDVGSTVTSAPRC